MALLADAHASLCAVESKPNNTTTQCLLSTMQFTDCYTITVLQPELCNINHVCMDGVAMELLECLSPSPAFWQSRALCKGNHAYANGVRSSCIWMDGSYCPFKWIMAIMHVDGAIRDLKSCTLAGQSGYAVRCFSLLFLPAARKDCPCLCMPPVQQKNQPGG